MKQEEAILQIDKSYVQHINWKFWSKNFLFKFSKRSVFHKAIRLSTNHKITQQQIWRFGLLVAAKDSSVPMWIDHADLDSSIALRQSRGSLPLEGPSPPVPVPILLSRLSALEPECVFVTL